MPIPIPDYRFLEPGETIKDGDEMLTFTRCYRGWRKWSPFGVWAPVEKLVGRECHSPRQIRRPIVPVTRRDVVT